MKIQLACTFSLLGFSCFAQNKAGQNSIQPSIGIVRYFDKGGILYDRVPPSDYLKANNTNGYNFGLQFERRTRNNLLLSADVQYGVRKYDVQIEQNMTGYDPVAEVNLRNFIYRESITASVNYLSFRILAGRYFALKNNWGISAKAGMSVRGFLNGDHRVTGGFIDYRWDNGITSTTSQVSIIKRQFGLGGTSNTLAPIEIYFGVQRTFDRSVVKNISFGIEASRNIFKGQNPEVVVHSTTEIYGPPIGSKDEFTDRNFSLGIRLSVGLWR
ncbi:MAG: hypothetical protein KF744_10310 [Taibaiella sp.]|nr:hypothetical protein [Taibaiella sp.]